MSRPDRKNLENRLKFEVNRVENVQIYFKTIIVFYLSLGLNNI